MVENLAPWRSHLQRALHRNRSHLFSRYLQLATVNERGEPNNRTVVFRGFLEKSNQLQIVTDTRSEKFKDLQINPLGEICWYFAKTREQFRIKGAVKLITENEPEELLSKERIKAWQKLSNSGKEQFSWANPAETRKIDQSLKVVEFDEKIPLNNFCLLLLNPQKVDHLELRGEPQNRYLYQLNQNNTWIIKSINP